MHQILTTDAGTTELLESNLGIIDTQAAADSFCGQFHETLEYLTETIESETNFLKEMKLFEMESLQNKKLALTRTYSNDIKIFAANADEIRRLAPTSVETLREKHQSLREAILENKRLLGTVKDLSQSLIRRTAERVANANQPKSYNGSGTGNSSQQVAAVACDKML